MATEYGLANVSAVDKQVWLDMDGMPAVVRDLAQRISSQGLEVTAAAVAAVNVDAVFFEGQVNWHLPPNSWLLMPLSAAALAWPGLALVAAPGGAVASSAFANESHLASGCVAGRSRRMPGFGVDMARLPAYSTPVFAAVRRHKNP